MNLTEGDVEMFILDTPSFPPQNAPLMLAQAPQAQQIASNKNRTLGVCQLIGNPDPEDTVVNGISPKVAVRSYFFSFENQRLEDKAKITILKNPSHGVLVDLGEIGRAHV